MCELIIVPIPPKYIVKFRIFFFIYPIYWDAKYICKSTLISIILIKLKPPAYARAYPCHLHYIPLVPLVPYFPFMHQLSFSFSILYAFENFDSLSLFPFCTDSIYLFKGGKRKLRKESISHTFPPKTCPPRLKEKGGSLLEKKLKKAVRYPNIRYLVLPLVCLSLPFMPLPFL